VQSSRPADDIDDDDGGSEGHDDDGEEQDADDHVREDVKEVGADAGDGGADGRFEDAVLNGVHGDADNSSLNADADNAPSVPPSVASPTSEPRSPVNTAGVGRGRGRGRGVSATAASANTLVVAQQKGLLVQALMNRSPVVTSASQSSGNSSSGKNVFDAVYAEAAKNKCAVMKEIATQRSEAETQQQHSEHAFKRDERCAQQDFQKELELQKQSVEHQFLREQQAVKLLADRQETKVRKGIEYDKTLASLLVADKSGALADDFEKRRKRERDGDAQDVDPLASFLSSLIPRRNG
jgi:hypothetical protein